MLTLASLSLFMGQSFGQPMGKTIPSRRAPGFSLPDLGFQQHDLLDYRGRWLLLLFVRTAADVSKTSAQLMEARRAQFGNRAAVLYVGVSPMENQATMTKFVADAKLTSGVVFDQGQMAASYFRATPTRPSIDMPHLFAIDPNGMIVKEWTEIALRDPTFGAQLDALVGSARTSK